MLIERKSTETIYPAASAEAAAAAEASRVIELSNNDQIMPRVYTPVLFFFDNGGPEKAEGGEDVAAAMAADGVLRRSLEEVLGVFYPCAGRYVERGEGGGLDLECAGQGVLFCVAMADCSIRDCIRTFSSQPSHEMDSLAANPPPSKQSITRVPLLTVQVTHFKGGGVCVGIRVHHNLCDGMSLAHFMQSWSEVALGKGISLLPSLDRGRLLVKKQNSPPPPPPPLDHRSEYRTTLPASLSTWPAMSSRVFSFTPASISLLKDKAGEGHRASSSAEHQHFTSFETLAAHLWRSITRARGLDPAQEVRLGISVNGRRRFDPPLDEGYFGNVTFCACIATPAGDLVANPFSRAATMVKEAIATVSDEYMRSALEWVERQRSPTSIFPAFWNPFTDVSITSWSRFPFYELDFGWGKPSLVRVPLCAFDGFLIFLPSPLGKGHIDAFITLKLEHMSNLESDPELVPT